tara:strand:- start:61 stop:513 length:453 start_codon:yes stop_codon:yes gene_type:complete
MKHLVAIMAVFLLMGCQTNDNTPKNITSPEKIVKEEKKQVPPQIELTNPVIVHKPLLCGDSKTIIEGIVKTHKERPISWFVSKETGINGDDHRVLVMANTETGTVTILEYPSPSVACFLVVGNEFKMTTQLKSKKTKGDPVSHKRVLTLN